MVLVFGALFARGVSVGDPAPLLEVEDSYGKKVNLQSLVKQGKYVVLWFYPRAKSPGCSMQGKRYAELYDELRSLGAEVFGVSSDPASEQCDFIDKLALKGGQLPDPSGELARAYKVKSILGFYNRDTIIIGPDGKVVAAYRSVNPFKDADTVLAFLKGKSKK